MKVLIVVVAVIIAIALVSLYLLMPVVLYDGSLKIESSSMSHSEMQENGIIDIGDTVYYNTVDSPDEIITFVDAQATDYSKYGSYGDVIVYRPNGLSEKSDGSEVMPITHRAIVWIELNTSQVNPDFDGIDFRNYSFDVPSLNMYGTTDDLVIDTCIIDLSEHSGLLKYYIYMNKVPHGGFITMGDYNTPYFDQPMSGSFEPVLVEWIVGKVVYLKD